MSIARHHAEWLSLVEVSGPFLSMPVLMRAFPQGLQTHDPELFRSLRIAYEEWEDNRKNRARWKGHSPVGLFKLGLAARINQPWRESTGPRTDEGKKKSRTNALKHGMRSREAIAAQREQAELNRLIRAVRQLTAPPAGPPNPG